MTASQSHRSPEGEELLPCPFCGSPATDRREIDGFPMIFCAGQECFGPQTTARNFEDARKQWNTRAATCQASEAELLALADGIEKKITGIGPGFIITWDAKPGVWQLIVSALRFAATVSAGAGESGEPAKGAQAAVSEPDWKQDQAETSRLPRGAQAAITEAAGIGEPFGYLLRKAEINDDYYWVSPASYAHVEERFRELYKPCYITPPTSPAPGSRSDILEEAARIAENGPADKSTDEEEEIRESIAAQIRLRKLKGADGIFAPAPVAASRVVGSLPQRLRDAAESFEGQRAWHSNAEDGDCEPHDSWQREMDDASKAALEAANFIEAALASPSTPSEPPADAVQAFNDIIYAIEPHCGGTLGAIRKRAIDGRAVLADAGRTG